MANAPTREADVDAWRQANRIMVFTVDDGLFGIHLDYVVAVEPRNRGAIYSVRAKKGEARPFILIGEEPAFIVDLREALDLRGILGDAERTAHVVVRSGSLLLALQADEIVGLQELDLRTQIPVPSQLMRDGGVSVGHLIDRNGTILAVLDPNRLLDGRLRDGIEPAVRAARAFVDRQHKMEALWASIVSQPTVADVRNYARLCKRNGRTKTANATKIVLRWLEGGTDATGDGSAGEVVKLAMQKSTGEVLVEQNGSTIGRLYMNEGRLLDAELQRESGLRALRHILELRDSRLRLVPGAPHHRPDRLKCSTVAALIQALEVVEERRGRRER